MKRTLIVFFIVVSAIMMAYLAYQNHKISEFLKYERGLKKGQKAYTFTASTLKGDRVSLESKITVLIFFNTECDACHVTARRWQELYEKYSAIERFQFIAVSSEDAETTEQFESENELTIPIVLDASRKLIDKYYVSAFPKIVIVDAKGEIAFYAPYNMRIMKAFHTADSLLSTLSS